MDRIGSQIPIKTFSSKSITFYFIPPGNVWIYMTLLIIWESCFDFCDFSNKFCDRLVIDLDT